MGSILDRMTDMMENKNLLYKVPAVDEVAVSCHCIIIAIQATILWRKRQKLSTTLLPILLLPPHTNFLMKSFAEPGFANQPYWLPLVRDYLNILSSLYFHLLFVCPSTNVSQCYVLIFNHKICVIFEKKKIEHHLIILILFIITIL